MTPPALMAIQLVHACVHACYDDADFAEGHIHAGRGQTGWGGERDCARTRTISRSIGIRA